MGAAIRTGSFTPLQLPVHPLSTGTGHVGIVDREHEGNAQLLPPGDGFKAQVGRVVHVDQVDGLLLQNLLQRRGHGRNAPRVLEHGIRRHGQPQGPQGEALAFIAGEGGTAAAIPGEDRCGCCLGQGPNVALASSGLRRQGGGMDQVKDPQTVRGQASP